MGGVLLLLSFTVAVPPAETEVTAADKKAFLELLTKLKTEREFFTEESVKKALPHTRALLALTAAVNSFKIGKVLKYLLTYFLPFSPLLVSEVDAP